MLRTVYFVLITNILCTFSPLYFIWFGLYTSCIQKWFKKWFQEIVNEGMEACLFSAQQL